MSKLLLALCAALALISAPAQARCRDELQDMKPRIDRLKNTQQQRYALALRWWGRALEAEPGSELECSNFLERARKALTMPMEQADNCATTYQPRCAPGGNMAGGNIAGGGYAGGGALGGGGGGGGGAAQVPFTPPGSVRSNSSSPAR